MNADDYEQAAVLLRSLLRESDHLLSTSEEYHTYYKLGVCYTQLGRENEAIPFFEKILKHSAERDSLLLSDTHAGLGICLEYTGKYDSSFYHYLQSYKCVEAQADTMRMARGLRNMAQLLRVMKRFDEARHFFAKVLRLTEGITDFRLLANIYNESAYLYELEGKLDSAKFFYEKLIEISKQNSYRKGESVGYSNIASVFENEGRPRDALNMKLRAIEIDRDFQDKYGLMSSYAGLKDPYLHLQRPDSALWALHIALTLCDTSWLVDLSGIYQGLYEVHKEMMNDKAALSAFEKQTEIERRLNRRNAREKISSLLVQFETEQKEQKIKLLEATNASRKRQIRFQWLLLGSLVFISFSGLLIGILALKNKTHRLSQMETELRSMYLLEEKRATQSDAAGLPAEKSDLLYSKNGLTSREQEIMQYLAKGCSNTAIAEKLFVSNNTVKYHIKNIYMKLDVKNRVEALLKCNENNHNH